MAQLSQIPGFVGYQATRVSSFDGRAIGKLTDTNHLQSLHMMEPSEYDKKIISLYTQTATFSNDFLQMINASTPYYPNGEYWQWNVNVPYRFPSIVAIPDSTAQMATPGIDGQEFQIVLDRKAFFIHDAITADRRYAPQFYITRDPQPYTGGGWLYTCTLMSPTPQTDYVDSSWLAIGLNMERVDTLIGEFDQEGSGLPELGQKITLYETMAGAYMIEHTVTKWADQWTMKDSKGNPLDVMVYTKYRNNQVATPEILDVRWEPFVETQMRKWMLETKVKRMIWSKPGTAKSGGQYQEVKKGVEGLYWKMRNNGNRVTYNRGELSINLFRAVFGDLFYRRVPMQRRKVKLYTNEAGMEAFNQAAKTDAMGSGLNLNAGYNDKFIEGSGTNLKMKYAFASFWTLDTGDVEIVHLQELDEPQTNTEYGQNKKSTPIFIVFDVSPDGDGTPKNNVREVRPAGAPSMTWGYVDGRQHHLGFAATQGMSSSSMFPGYKIWMEDRSDIFVEDLSRMVLIEENPQY